MLRPRWAGSLAILLSLAACSPTFNWRVLRVDAAPMQALMPCKAESAAREVPLAGVPTTLHLHSCDAGGLSFAVAWAHVGETARAGAAIDGWRRAALVSAKADPALADASSAAWEARVVGADLAIGLRAEGRNHRGEPLTMQAVHFSRGAFVMQAAIYGPTIAPEVANTFFEGVQLP